MSVVAPPRYRLVLPPGFVLFPVRDRTDDEIAAMVREHYRSLPRDSFGPRIDRVAEQILEIVRPAREAQVLDLVVPMGVPWRAPVSLGIALSVASPSSGAGAWDSLPGERLETEAGPAVRTTERFPSAEDPREITRLAGTQYVWRVPGDDARLLLGVHTISGAGDPDLQPVVEALQELSDLILETMRWDEHDPSPADDTAPIGAEKQAEPQP
ncbi:MAG TPA: hypothetical protein VFY91_05350 [Microbacterium sp.]|nr:hypothetical protein [Microbacterium sp.]